MELELTELETPDEVEFPVFNINAKHFLPAPYLNEKENFEVVEKYIYASFSCLPFSKLKKFNVERHLVEAYCGIFVFHNKLNILCSIVEKICTDRTVFFFEILNQRIKNDEFTDCEEFLLYFIRIWNNFLTVIIHISDMFKVFTYYCQTNDQTVRSVAEIFCGVWRNSLRNYSEIKEYLFMNVYGYMKRDQLYAEKNFFKYIYNNIKDGMSKDALLISVEGLNRNTNRYHLNGIDDDDDDAELSGDMFTDERLRENDAIKDGHVAKLETCLRKTVSFTGSITRSGRVSARGSARRPARRSVKESLKGSLRGSVRKTINDERGNGKRVRLNSYGEKQVDINKEENEFFHLLSEEIKDDLEKYKSVEKCTMRGGGGRYGPILRNAVKENACKFLNLKNGIYKVQKINDLLLSKCLKIIDQCDLYDEYAKLYIRLTLNYYDKKMKNRLRKKHVCEEKSNIDTSENDSRNNNIHDYNNSSNNNNSNNNNSNNNNNHMNNNNIFNCNNNNESNNNIGNSSNNNSNNKNNNNDNNNTGKNIFQMIEDISNLPFEIETFLCNEQMRCHKFMKIETEKELLKKLKENLIVQYIHILYSEEMIKRCIMYEQLESLRILYIFAVNMLCDDEFCKKFFRCAQILGTVVIQRIMDNRENMELINEAMTDLANFKLNIDRIIIVSFKHSSRFIKKWKETFEQLLCTGKHTDRYMPYVVSLYLNNLLMMHNACMKKMKKVNLVYKEFMNRAHKQDDKTGLGSLENDISRSIGFCGTDDTNSDISVDSDGIYILKKKILKLKQLKKQKGSEHMSMAEVRIFSDKLKKVFIRYTDIGKNVLNKITIMLSVFKFLDNKERFEKHFRMAMSKRLLNDEYLNIFLDANVFKVLKKECGSPYTKKIEHIIKDIQEEKALMESFYNLMENKTNVPYFIKKRKFWVKTVCDDAWDFLKIKENVIYPDFIKLCNDNFVQFYKANKKGRSAVMQPLLGLCILKVNLEMMNNIQNITFSTNESNVIYNANDSNTCDPHCSYLIEDDAEEKMGEEEWCDLLIDSPSFTDSVSDKPCYNIDPKKMKCFCFIVTIIQGVVLLLFNKKYEYTTEEIETLTGLKKSTIQHFLKPLYEVEQTKILLYDEANDKLKLNYLFRPNKKYVKVKYADYICNEDVAIPPNTEAEDITADTNLFIDAAVVRYLKINTSASEQDICKHVNSKKPGTTAEAVKARIDSLLQKEFIGFKDNMYWYI